MRANGEGSIYLRKDGYFVASLSLPDGKRKTYYGKTEESALKKMRDAQRQLDKGANLLADDPLFGDFLASWLEDVVKMTVRHSTYTGYKSAATVRIIPGIGKIRLSKITPQVIQSFLNSLTKDKLSPRTVQHHRGVIRRALQQALKWNLVTRNVADLVETPRIKRKKELNVSPDSIRAVLDAVHGHRLETLFLCAAALGPRIGELLGLEWSDFDEHARTISITKNLQKIDGTYQFVELKTARSRRKLPVPDAVFQSLTAHRIRQQDEMRAYPQTKTHDYIFRSKFGTPLAEPNVWLQFQKLLKKSGLGPMRVHDLRHACISLLLSAGTDVVTVSEIAGHSNTSMTLSVYAHAIPGQSKKALGALDAILQSNTTPPSK